MPRLAVPLTALRVKNAKPGRYGDGNGLFLLVRPNGTKFWVFRYRLGGTLREMGLGSANLFPLADARQRAAELFRKVKLGTDPLAERKAGKAKMFGDVPEPRESATRLVTRIVLAEFRRTGLRAQAKDLRAAFVGVKGAADHYAPSTSIAVVLAVNKAVFDKKTDHRGSGWGLVEWSQPAGTIEVAPAPSFLLFAP